jgi:exosortase H (IPTLxxWG-CTERM-specific)
MALLRDFVKTPSGRFVVRYALILAVGFFVLALRPVNDRVVNPYTTFVAHESKAALNLFGEKATVRGQILSSPRFSVAIYNGCNGLEAILIFASGVLAFPAPPLKKVIGLLLGFVAIQLANIVRVVSLFYVGIFKPAWFSAAHIFIWQSIIIILSVVLWLVWVNRYALAPTKS